MTANTLVFFTATGAIEDVEQPNPAGSSINPQLLDVSAYVNFYPGIQTALFPAGYAVDVPNLTRLDASVGNTLVPIAPITGRLMNGVLSSIIIGDPPGVGLLANSVFLGLEQLFYHVQFVNVTYGGTNQVIDNFAFAAPTTAVTLDLFDAATTHFPYFGP